MATKCYRPHGIPVPVRESEHDFGVSAVTADGSLLDRDGHYVTDSDECED